MLVGVDKIVEGELLLTPDEYSILYVGVVTELVDKLAPLRGARDDAGEGECSLLLVVVALPVAKPTEFPVSAVFSLLFVVVAPLPPSALFFSSISSCCICNAAFAAAAAAFFLAFDLFLSTEL